MRTDAYLLPAHRRRPGMKAMSPPVDCRPQSTDIITYASFQFESCRLLRRSVAHSRPGHRSGDRVFGKAAKGRDGLE